MPSRDQPAAVMRKACREPREVILRRLAVLLAVVAATAGGCAAEDPDAAARSDLERRLRAAPRIERFAFDHSAGGTRVNDCFLPNQRFSGIVDHKSSSLLITDDGEPAVVVTARTAFVRRSLFAAGAVPAEWLRIDPEPPGPVRDAINRALGPELAGYALAGGLPPSGNETARATLAAATKVERLRGTSPRAQTVDRFELTVPSEELIDAQGPAGAEDSAVGDAVVEVWVAAVGSVPRIAVRPAPTDGEEEDPGWIVEYRPLATTGPVPDVSSAARVESIDLSGLAPAQLAPVCEVPL